jgi:Fic family protein
MRQTLGNFFSESSAWYEKIGAIHALLERVKLSEEQCGDVLRLRKLNRIMSIHSSAAIEGNRLTLAQATAIINGKRVLGLPQDIKEVQNAYAVYEKMRHYNPYTVRDFLRAHALMTSSLIEESGKFRTIDVAVVTRDRKILHRGAPPVQVPTLIKRLLQWGETTATHPLIKSSAMHYMIEHIHPFRDGNGRIGRFWQTLVLSKWNSLFEWLPVETIIHYNQAGYYKALQKSHAGVTVDAKPFIDFMLGIIENSLYKYIDIAAETTGNIGDVGVNVGVNVGVKIALLKHLQDNPDLSAKELAALLHKTSRTIERYIKELREQGILQRIGPDKTGHWKINERHNR